MSNRHLNNGWNIIINLASQPRRNLKLYRLMIFGLLGIFAVLVFYLVIFNLQSFSEFKKAARSNHQLVHKVAELGSENKKFSREVQNLSQKFKPAVDELNNLIAQKAFSWVKFFSCLEEALPSGSYLVSLNPSRSSSSMEFRIKIGLNNRDDLDLLLKNLQQQGFKEIRVLSETLLDNKFQVEMGFKDAEAK
ncbi:MAG: hypothetical protein C0168_02505 [Candidatus Aminicenantes bacterium]|nr:MAG: hypothetical protein C0168_02505 [Candidatus Aminicenantes bacterium]